MNNMKNKPSLKKIIENEFNVLFNEHVKGLNAPSLSGDTILLETGLDSLGFALLVVRLENTLGFDPFVLSSEAFYPKTFGEFVSFYEQHQP